MSTPKRLSAERLADIKEWTTRITFDGRTMELLDHIASLEAEVSDANKHRDEVLARYEVIQNQFVSKHEYQLRAENASLIKALKFLIDHSPHDGDNESACLYCDMGGAGYSSNGDGNHDDHPKHICPVVVAKKTIEGIKSRCRHGVHGEDCFTCFPTK